MSRIASVEIGEFKVTALCDGELVLPADMLINLRAEDEVTIRNDAENSLSYTNFNAYLIQSKARNILIDAGCRELFGPTCGFLPEALSEAGLEPEDITDLFFTHLHPDHIAGALTLDGGAVFKNAHLRVIGEEHAYWTGPEFDDIEVNGAEWSGLAKAVLSAYEGRLDLIPAGSEIVAGVHAVAIPGHTPGHSGFRVEDGGAELLHLGDILHIMNVQLIDPNAATIFDVDSETALASRRRMLDMASHEGSLCTSGHWLAPKFGHIERRGSGYAMTD